MKLKQDRSRKSGHAHSKNIQDFPALRLNAKERAESYFWAWLGMRPKMTYYENLPPKYREIVDRVVEAADAAARDEAA